MTATEYGIRRSKTGKYHWGNGQHTSCNSSGQVRRGLYTRIAQKEEIANAPEDTICRSCFPRKYFPNGLPQKEDS